MEKGLITIFSDATIILDTGLFQSFVVAAQKTKVFGFDEAIAIAQDYLRHLNKTKIGLNVQLRGSAPPVQH